MLSAISFGVFCRSAPSTRAIIRSRKVEPWAAVIRTMIQSESTWVPPVTAERSPPDSRMTGADSPVIAASLTEATPSITSPSEGMRSPASTSTMSPGRGSSAGTSSKASRRAGSRRRFAAVSVRVAARLAACALPRPSATASAKLAKSTVNQSQSTIWKEKPMPPAPVARSRRKRTVVRSATTATTNITGLRTSARGSSLAKAEPSAGTRMSRREEGGGGSGHVMALLIRRSGRPTSPGARRSGRGRGPGRR